MLGSPVGSPPKENILDMRASQEKLASPKPARPKEKDKRDKKEKKEKKTEIKKSGGSFFSNLFKFGAEEPREIEISTPTNFKQQFHVGWNAEKGEFEGLPPELAKQLEMSGITKDDQKANPEQVLRVMKFHNELATGGVQKKVIPLKKPLGPAPVAPAPVLKNKTTNNNNTTNLLNPAAQNTGLASPPPAPNPRPAAARSMGIDELSAMSNSKPSGVNISPKAATLKPKKAKPANAVRPLSQKPMSSSPLKMKTSTTTGTPVAALKPQITPKVKPSVTTGVTTPVGELKPPMATAPQLPTLKTKPVKPTLKTKPVKPTLKPKPATPEPRPNPLQVDPQPTPTHETPMGKPTITAKPPVVAPESPKPTAVEPMRPPIPKPTPTSPIGRPPPKTSVVATPPPEDNLPKLTDLVSGENPETLYANEKMIGQGASGSVYTATHVSSGGVVALKKMVIAQQVKKDVLINEIMTMKMSHHANIVNFINSYIVEGSLWVAMEYVEGASLTEVIEANKASNPLKEGEIAYVTGETLKGLEYLHSKEIIHRDIKSDNILCSLSGQVKITDFGYSAQLSNDNQKRSSQVGTTYWMSPEVINADSDYDTKTDIWSLGVMVYEMVEGDPPYIDKPVLKALLLITTEGLPGWSHPEKLSGELKDFVGLMCQFDPSIRPTATQLLTNQFLRKSSKPETMRPYVEHAKNEAEKNQNFSLEDINEYW